MTKANFCEKCKVRLADNIVNCPLCGKHVNGKSSGDVITAYPAVDHDLLHKINVASLLKTILFIGMLLCIAVDLLFTPGQWWSVYVITGSVAVHILVLYPVGKMMFYWKEVTLNTITALLYIIFIDFYPDRVVTWSVTYVVPAALAVFSLTVTIIILATKKAAVEGLSGLIIILIISLTMYLLGVLLFVRIITDYTVVPAFVALAVSAVFFVVLAIFRRKEFSGELFKRFRF